MATEAERYLAKARESLASAEADVAAGRNNSAANRAYYAAFQAAIAALLQAGVTSTGAWQHNFVMNEFSGKLIWRRKVFSSRLRTVLPDLFKLRIIADYRPEEVPQRKVMSALGRSQEIVGAVQEWLSQSRLGEPKATYGGEMTTKLGDAKKFVEDVKQKIESAYPQFQTVVVERGPREYTLEVYGTDESVWDIDDLTSEMTADILYERGVWIVVLPLDQSWRNQ